MNDNVFIISNPNKHRVGGIQIKENTAKRKMKFTTNDLAYTCDRDALHKKIDGMREQIEKNDTINEFPTVDEANEALEKVKSDIPTVTNEDVFRIDFINIEDSDNIQTSKQNFALLLLKGFSLKGTQVPDNTSIEGKHVPESDYEEEVYYTPNFINGCYSYYFKFSDNSEMKIKTSQAAQLLN